MTPYGSDRCSGGNDVSVFCEWFDACSLATQAAFFFYIGSDVKEKSSLGCETMIHEDHILPVSLVVQRR